MNDQLDDKPLVLVAEDNWDTAENLRLYLEHHNMRCITARNGTDAIRLFEQQKPGLVILDWMMPERDGVEVCAHIRRKSQIPIIMVTARITPDDLVVGLEAGADEYVKKPFEHKELIARIKAHLRRQHFKPVSDETGALGPWRWHELNKQIFYCDQELALTKTEYQLLMILLKSPERIFTREQLFVAVFGYDSESSDRTVDVHLHNARKKLNQIDREQHGISSVYGVGYKMKLIPDQPRK
ncbi:response regulator transcription factor [Kordiimonas sp. SCSIO 12603]|uniref:response regulator transcription factor n=1 Tax=Kordiimonas sp. SCSIO 12603 TaxID=2829596 RepID=UPI002105ACBF|nr:response regulator transcription factor [Kordiimonas sp. SCSIO 12603]UTW58798.1 response regulator transcription factor [Kordiimonas sp. SCSIO 12603]